ncbi:MAG: hypothetical protein RMH74_02705, partial [Candidatus Caldarchaeum sp.]|nr:hypothetical protein [Candidatus Caldarchaeum sp.]
MKRLVEEARALLRNAGVEEARLDVQRQAGYGEVSTAVAFELSKKSGKDPFSIAKQIVEAVDTSGSRFV